MNHKIATTALASVAHLGRRSAKGSPTKRETQSYSTKIELDLLDVMLDLDPGALVWSPSKHPNLGYDASESR